MSEIEPESYLTKRNPTIDDWLVHNAPVFDALRNGAPVEEGVYFAPLTDFDEYALDAGVELEDYFAQLKERVGLLGCFGLRLVHSDMDDATHVVIQEASRLE